MDKITIAAFLGRPLTPTEDTNFDLYLKLARQSLDGLLCMTLCDADDPKVYEAREGYSTVFTDIFTDIQEVKVNGDVVAASKYSPRQWDKRNGSWYNSLVFEDKFESGDEVEVTASWGFSKTPVDLQAVLAGLFGLITKKNKFDGTISSKQVEDFRISFNNDADLDEEFAKKYGDTISKYSLCNLSSVRHGSTESRTWSLRC